MAESTKIEREVERLRLSEAVAYFSVVVHMDHAGRPVPTVTIMADGKTEQRAGEFQHHLSAIANLLRESYAG
jgi:hypothetical protein